MQYLSAGGGGGVGGGSGGDGGDNGGEDGEDAAHVSLISYLYEHNKGSLPFPWSCSYVCHTY